MQEPNTTVDAGLAGSQHELPEPADAVVHRYRDSIFIARPPDEVFELVSDITRMGEWSPVCTGGWWDEGEQLRVGSWFTGTNEVPGRTWETRSLVVAAEPGREFAFIVGGTYVRWGYALTPVEGGTFLEESWEWLAEGLTKFAIRFGDDTAHQIANRIESAHHGIPKTLAAIKAVAESA